MALILSKSQILSASETPAMLAVQHDAIPEALEAQPRWLGWCWKRKNGKWTKPPLNLNTGGSGDSTDPNTWCFYERAAKSETPGLGFALGDGYAGVDIDDCRNAETGELTPLAQQVIAEMDSYTEVSPSGTGVKILCRGTLPKGVRTKSVDKTIEIYTHGRYFTITGDRVEGTNPDVQDRQTQLEALHRKYVGGETAKPKAKSVESTPSGGVIAIEGCDELTLTSMLICHSPPEDESDGSKRLFGVCCRAVEHALVDDAAIATIRAYEQVYPFPVDYSDDAIVTRLRDAEKKTVRGNAYRDINVGNRDLAIITAIAWRSLWLANMPPSFYRFGGSLSRIESNDLGEPVVVTLTPDRVRHHLARAAKWYQFTRGDRKNIEPPMSVVKDVLATPDPPLPVLKRIVETPVFACDGSLQTEPGYHAASQCYYRPSHGLVIPTVSLIPTPEEIAAARGLICQELLGDFPFVGPPELATAVAFLLLPFARDLIDGPSPLHLFEKPTPGTGASLLVDVLSFPSTGRSIATMTEAQNEEEWRKKLTAKLRSTPSAILIDNLRAKLDSASLAAALTATIWSDRILGVSDVTHLAITNAWAATGNNPNLSNEIARRSVRIRMDARMEAPQLRDQFRHPDLKLWVREHRGGLVHAALTLIQAWIAEGRPAGTTTLGMYESWAKVMGGILDVAGVPGLLGNLADLYAASDEETRIWREFIGAWWGTHQDKPVLAKHIFDLAINEADLPLGDGSDHSRKSTLGKLLAERNDRVFNLPGDPARGVLKRGGKVQGAVEWSLAVAV